jgi:hypothetical protein
MWQSRLAKAGRSRRKRHSLPPPGNAERARIVRNALLRPGLRLRGLCRSPPGPNSHRPAAETAFPTHSRHRVHRRGKGIITAVPPLAGPTQKGRSRRRRSLQSVDHRFDQLNGVQQGGRADFALRPRIWRKAHGLIDSEAEQRHGGKHNCHRPARECPAPIAVNKRIARLRFRAHCRPSTPTVSRTNALYQNHIRGLFGARSRPPGDTSYSGW